MTNDCMAARWGEIDSTIEPDRFIRYLDYVSSLEAIQVIKRNTYDLLQIRDGDTILDIGCGLGDDLRGLASRVGSNGRVVGLDTSKTLLSEAHKRLAGLNLRVELHRGDAHNLAFAANSFDGCRAERILVHLTTPERALAEMFRVARPGAKIVVFDLDWETLIVDTPNRQLTRTMLNSQCDSAGSRWIGRQLRRLFIEAGLTDVEVSAETLTFTDFAKADFVFQFREIARQAQIKQAISPLLANEWLDSLSRADQNHSFFAAATGFYATGRKIG